MIQNLIYYYDNITPQERWLLKEDAKFTLYVEIEVMLDVHMQDLQWLYTPIWCLINRLSIIS